MFSLSFPVDKTRSNSCPSSLSKTPIWAPKSLLFAHDMENNWPTIWSIFRTSDTS